MGNYHKSMEYFLELSVKEVTRNQVRSVSPLIVFHFCFCWNIGSVRLPVDTYFLCFWMLGGRRLAPRGLGFMFFSSREFHDHSVPD